MSRDRGKTHHYFQWPLVSRPCKRQFIKQYPISINDLHVHVMAVAAEFFRLKFIAWVSGANSLFHHCTSGATSSIPLRCTVTAIDLFPMTTVARRLTYLGLAVTCELYDT